MRTQRTETEEVIFKESDEWDLNEFDTNLYKEKNIYETIGDHGNQIEF